ncbi:MAG: hypothetical protein ABSE47_16920, partial [Acidimicrobiales bacterium]
MWATPGRPGEPRSLAQVADRCRFGQETVVIGRRRSHAMGDSGDTTEDAHLAELRYRAELAEDEIAELRRRLQEAPQRVRSLEERLLEAKGQLSHATSQNERLTFTLQQAKEHIAALREEVEKLTQPPAAYGTYLETNEDGTVDIFSSGRKMRVSLHPELDVDALRKGQEVVLNESL